MSVLSTVKTLATAVQSGGLDKTVWLIKFSCRVTDATKFDANNQSLPIQGALVSLGCLAGFGWKNPDGSLQTDKNGNPVLQSGSPATIYPDGSNAVPINPPAGGDALTDANGEATVTVTVTQAQFWQTQALIIAVVKQGYVSQLQFATKAVVNQGTADDYTVNVLEFNQGDYSLLPATP